MPITGKGILMTAMNIEAEHEAEFNHWYDREHIAERVAIDGFIEARRFKATSGAPAYFATYTTAQFEDLDAPAYRAALAKQTEWSRRNISRFKDMIRVVGRITISRGYGRGAAMAVVRLRPQGQTPEHWRSHLHPQLDPADIANIISMQLIESDPVLSKSLTDPDRADPGAGDWWVLIEGTEIEAVDALAQKLFGASELAVISRATYRLLWDLHKADLSTN